MRIGPYEVLAPLGAGGMGEVYRARDSRLKRDVAIKILPAALAGNAERLARFEREAQVLATLSHPNIAAIYGFEENGGAGALVMELVEGQTLAERLHSGAIPLEEALSTARQIAAGLEAAHEKGIVHRDLKPANIKLTPHGAVKILDFGLAKALDDAPSSAATSKDSPTLTLEATRAGVILGTAAYMSPEQARGKPVDKRADIWAFGVILLEMLTGRTTFQGETTSDTLAAVLRSEIPWATLPAGTPADVQRLIARCLERDPKLRLRDIGDAWIEIDSPAPAASATAAASRAPWIAAGAAVIAGVAGIAWGLWQKPASTAPRPVVRWTYSHPGPAYFVSISRDGTRLAFVTLKDHFAISVRMINQLEARNIPGTENSYLPTFSPDGEWLAYINNPTNPTLKKIPVAGGSPVALCEVGGNPVGLDWTDDGIIIFGTTKGLMRVSVSGGKPEPLTSVDAKKMETTHQYPQVLPGGKAILFGSHSTRSARIAVLDLQTHTTRIVVENGSAARYVPSGHLVYYRSGTLYATPFDLAKLRVTGPEAPVIEGVSATFSDLEGGDYSVSENGELVYMRGSNTVGKSALNWADRKGVTQPIGEPQYWGTGRLSPDGGRIANSIRSGDSEDVWVYDLARGAATRLTFDGQSHNPVWSRDGRWITFSSMREQKPGIYRVPADGSGKPELLLETAGIPLPCSWSPDNKTLVYSELLSGNRHLWKVSLPGGKPAQIHDPASFEPSGDISPDGRWLAYASMDSGTEEVYVQPFPGPGPKVRISTAVGQTPRWSRDGKELFFWSGTVERDAMSVQVKAGATFQAGLPQFLFKLAQGSTWDAAPDGKRFLVEIPVAATAGATEMLGVDNWFEELRRKVPVK